MVDLSFPLCLQTTAESAAGQPPNTHTSHLPVAVNAAQIGQQNNAHTSVPSTMETTHSDLASPALLTHCTHISSKREHPSRQARLSIAFGIQLSVFLYNASEERERVHSLKSKHLFCSPNSVEPSDPMSPGRREYEFKLQEFLSTCAGFLIFIPMPRTRAKRQILISVL